MNLYDDDPARDAELLAQQWADNYVGRRRVSDEVIEDLVQAVMFRFAEEDAAAEALERIAAHRIGHRGQLNAARATARSIAEERLVDLANEQMTQFLGHSTPEPCRTPWEHDRDYARWLNGRPAEAEPGRCGYCGGAR